MYSLIFFTFLYCSWVLFMDCSLNSPKFFLFFLFVGWRNDPVHIKHFSDHKIRTFSSLVNFRIHFLCFLIFKYRRLQVFIDNEWNGLFTFPMVGLLFIHIIFSLFHFIHVYLCFLDLINELVQLLSFLNGFLLSHIALSNQVIVLCLNLQIVQVYLFFYPLVALIEDLEIVQNILLLIPKFLFYLLLVYFLFFRTL